MSSRRFLYFRRKIDLIEHILILEKKHNNLPIQFCFNGHFFFWKDIQIIIEFMEKNAQIEKIYLITNEDKYTIRSAEDYKRIEGLENQVLREFSISTYNPELHMEMDLQRIFISLADDVDENTKEKETEITEYLSIFLNKGKTHEGWYCTGSIFTLLEPPNSPDIEKLYA